MLSSSGSVKRCLIPDERWRLAQVKEVLVTPVVKN